MQYSQNVDYFILGLLLKCIVFHCLKRHLREFRVQFNKFFSLEDSFKVIVFFREEIDMKRLISQWGKSEA